MLSSLPGIRDRTAATGAHLRGASKVGSRDRPNGPRSPCQIGHVERLIGSIRRECIDHVVIFGEGDLRRVLTAYAEFYNCARTHLAFAKDAPIGRPVQTLGYIVSVLMLGGIHHQCIRTA
jgi:hypothetical protein